MQSGKNFKCWGVSYGVVGDLIMGLPVLTYLEKKFPGSYKYWVIEKKVAITAPLYFNHPLIDCIRIMEEEGFSEEDYKIASTCQFKCTMDGWQHDEPDWYNHRDQVEETARIAGIYDLKEWLTPEEMRPKLTPWWDDGSVRENTIAIWPFAGRDAVKLRSPSVKWWETLIIALTELKYDIMMLGHPNDPWISGVGMYDDYRSLPYFEQVQKALQCKMSIGTDSGNMWVMGAYSHPGITLMTYWLPGHNQNIKALFPINKNGLGIYEESGINDIPHDKVLGYIKEKMDG